MSSSNISLEFSWSNEVDAIVQELKEDTILISLPGLALSGLILMGSPAWFLSPSINIIVSLTIFLLTYGIWIMQKKSFLVASWMLIIGYLIIDLLVVIWGGIGSVIFLLVLPVGLATLTIGLGAGISIASLCTAFLIFSPSSILLTADGLRFVTGMGIWSTVGMIWLALRPLLTAFRWAWFGHERNQTLLEEARDYQVQLQQTLEDLTNANQQLLRLNRLTDGLRQLAEEANRVKAEFVAKVSHELRTPLNMIIGFGKMIVEAPQTYGKRLPPSLMADLEIILRNSQHLSDLIDDVLDLSQIEAGKMALIQERASLQEIILTAIIAVRPLFESKNLYINVQIPPELPLVLCDRTRIREVVLNLLSNAGRLTEIGGVNIEVEANETNFTVSISDTGPGIEPESINELFQPFHQLDNSIHRKHGGSGLGLSISKSFVEMHDGKMWLESTPGVGTTFFFTLPIKPSKIPTISPNRWINPDWEYFQRTRRPTPPAPSLRPRFVILESGNSLSYLIKRYFDNAEIVTVSNFKEAFHELSAVPAQALLINDISLDVSFQRLNASPGMEYGIPIIICSVPGTIEAANSLGVADYLIKPVSRDTLLAVLSKLKLRGNTVLVVDDEPDALRLFWRILASADVGYQVLTASDGLQAIELMRQQKPDVILLDLTIPNMNGFQFLATKKEEIDMRDIPVVIVSASDPTGQPVVSNAITITRGGGLSLSQLLVCIDALSSVLSPISSSHDLIQLEAPPS